MRSVVEVLGGSKGKFRLTILVISCSACMAMALTGCSGGKDERPTIVVTTNILGDITRNIVGNKANVEVLMKSNADPHSFAVSAKQAADIEQADLVVYNGLGLEENVLRHVNTAAEGGVSTVEVGAGIDPIDYGSAEMKGQKDPHFWTDPYRAGRAVDLIGMKIEQDVDGVDHQAVKRNTKSYGKRIDKLSSWMKQKFERIPESRRKLVTNHHVFGYMAERFNFTVVGTVIPSGTTLASPSAADLESLTQAIDRAGVKAVFADSSQPKRLARVLKKESKTDIAVVSLFSESLSQPGKGAETYIKMMRSNTAAICEGLAKK